jgi:hypothetical protein
MALAGRISEVRGRCPALTRASRLELIQAIEDMRQSRLLCYVTGDRRGFETKIAGDVFSFVYERLSEIGSTKSIDLFLYTTGGITIVGWGLVNVIREFCERFGVIIPFKAHSCGTLIALGADEIIMGKLGQLSPVDPSVTSPHNPQAPGQQQPGPLSVLPISVEDVLGYLELARKEANLAGEAPLTTIFHDLTERVHPLALGSVYRARQQIRMLSKKLLQFHMPPESERDMDRIVTTLTRELYSHDYIIGRKEAKEGVGLNVVDVDPALERAVWKLFQEYEALFELNVPYSPPAFLGQENSRRGVFTRAIIESSGHVDAFVTEKEVRRIQVNQPGVPGPAEAYQERVVFDGWRQGTDD